MTKIGLTELRKKLMQILKRAEQGESFEVTYHNKTIAQLGPVGSSAANNSEDSDADKPHLSPKEVRKILDEVVMKEPLDSRNSEDDKALLTKRLREKYGFKD